MTRPFSASLGRLPQFDERSREYSIRTLVEPKPLRSYTWSCATVLDQLSEGVCVGCAWAHEMAARPRVWPVDLQLARLIYREATFIDPWPANDQPVVNYNHGTSILAGAKIATQLGHYKEYRWAFDMQEALLALSYFGPGVAGVNWYESMYDPDASGLLHITGQPVGGHAILVNGLNVAKKLVRVHNSWGSSWGINGEAFLTFDDFERLLDESGEFCIPVLRTK